MICDRCKYKWNYISATCKYIVCHNKNCGGIVARDLKECANFKSLNKTELKQLERNIRENDDWSN